MKKFTHTLLSRGLAITVGLAATLLSSCGNEVAQTETTETEGNTPVYSQRQQVFSMCMLSNISAFYNGNSDIQTPTATAVNNVLADAGVQQLIGTWQCVWGPFVYKNRNNKGEITDTAANTMFIVRQQGTPNFIVAIAGTDPASSFEWEFEDLNVLPIEWKLGDKTKGTVSTATKMGLGVLETMVSNNSFPGVFLNGCADTIPGMQIWVTGHSLGGALAPAFALHLSDTWSSKNKATINVLAAAGASPGDSTFAAYYNQQLGANTVRVWNTRDLIPHGYELDMMVEVDTLYPRDSVTALSPTDSTILAMAANLVGKLNYRQLRPATTIAFTSAIYTQDSAKHANANFSDTSFMGQVLNQHIPAYGVYFQTIDFQMAVQRVLKMPNPFFTQGAYLVPVWASNADH